MDTSLPVMVIDESEEECQRLAHLLRCCGLPKIVTHIAPQAAFQQLRAQKFNLAVINTRLGAFSGIDLLAEIRRDYRLVRQCVLMVSADKDPNLMLEAHKLRFDGYLFKPFCISALLTKIQTMPIYRLAPYKLDVCLSALKSPQTLAALRR